MPNPVVHFEIITRDPVALGRFYREAFGWDVDTEHPGPGAGGSRPIFSRDPMAISHRRPALTAASEALHPTMTVT